MIANLYKRSKGLKLNNHSLLFQPRCFHVRRFFDLFDKYGGHKTGQLKLKSPKQLQEVLDISRFLLAEVNANHNPELEDNKSKLEQLKAVLEM